MKKTKIFVAFSVSFWLIFHAFLASAQIPNSDFSQWQNNEPVSWRTNNIYDDQAKLQQAVVGSAGNSGAKLLVKKVIYRAETPSIISFYGGKLESKLAMFMPKAGTAIQLSFNYSFKSDSADVLKAEISLNSRNNEIGTLNENKICVCQLKNDFGGEILMLPASENSKTISLKAVFPNNADPNKLPPECAMYVWKIKFWLENSATHLHEKTVAIIEKIQP